MSRQAIAAAEAAGRAAEEAGLKAAEAMPRAMVKKLLGSWEFMLFLIIAMLAAIFGAVAISVGISSIGLG